VSILRLEYHSAQICYLPQKEEKGAVLSVSALFVVGEEDFLSNLKVFRSVLTFLFFDNSLTVTSFARPTFRWPVVLGFCPVLYSSMGNP